MRTKVAAPSPITLQAAYALRKAGHCSLVFCWKAKVFNHYGYSWACWHDHESREAATACAKAELDRLQAIGQ